MIQLDSMESIFTKIYRENFWGGKSRSGRGSDLVQTETIRTALPKLFKKLEIKSLLDIPCGDFFWLKEVNLDFLSYIGADVVDDIVKHNSAKFSKPNRKFIKLNIIKDELPKVDLIFCRDLLPHFSFKDIFKAIKNIKKSGSKYLLTTSHVLSQKNVNIKTGETQELNLFLPPFSFPKPLRIIDERCPEVIDVGKSLMLWKISTI